MFEPDIKQIKRHVLYAAVRHIAGYSSEPLTWETNSGDWGLSGCCRRPPERREERQKERKMLQKIHCMGVIFNYTTRNSDQASCL